MLQYFKANQMSLSFRDNGSNSTKMGTHHIDKPHYSTFYKNKSNMDPHLLHPCSNTMHKNKILTSKYHNLYHCLIIKPQPYFIFSTILVL